MSAGQQLQGLTASGATFAGPHELLGAARRVVIPFNFSQMAPVADTKYGMVPKDRPSMWRSCCRTN